MSWIFDKPIAHRGLHRSAIVENSIESFKLALENNHPIELDIQLSRDEELIVFHDKNFQRLCSDSRRVDETDYQDIRQLKLNYTESYIPLLSEVLDLVQGRVPILIELKNPPRNGKMEKILQKMLEGYEGEVALQSFDPLSLIRLRRKDMNYPIGLLSARLQENFQLRPWEWLTVEFLLLVPFIRPDFLACHIDSLRFYPVRFFSLYYKIPLISWTITNIDEKNSVLEECENIIFENDETLQ